MVDGALSRVAADALPGLRTAQNYSPAKRSASREQERELTLANLVEGAAVGEVLFLRFRPAAELLIDGKQLQFREFVSIFLRHIRIARAVEVLRRNLPGLPASRDTSGTLPPHRRVPFLSTTLSTTETVGSARIDSLGVTISNLSLPSSLVASSASFSRGDQYVADAAFYEGIGRTARAGVQHFHVFIQRLDEFLGLSHRSP